MLDLGSDDPYGDYWDDFPYEDFYGAVTVTEVADPWVPEDTEDAPPVGSRFVAIYVTVENSSSGDYPVHVSTYGFKIADREKFVYQAVDAGPRPALPTAVSIDKGERARGWVTFEVAEDSVIESITYFDTNISLPSVSAH